MHIYVPLFGPYANIDLISPQIQSLHVVAFRRRCEDYNIALSLSPRCPTREKSHSTRHLRQIRGNLVLNSVYPGRTLCVSQLGLRCATFGSTISGSGPKTHQLTNVVFRVNHQMHA